MTEKNNDVDALLAAFESDQPMDKKQDQEVEPNSEHSELRNFGERAGSFKIDPRHSAITGTDSLRRNSQGLSVNPEDFTDQSEVRAESRRTRVLISTLGLVIFLIVLGFVGYSIIQNSTAQVTYTIPDGETEERRFLNLFPNAPVADTTKPFIAEAFDQGLAVNGSYTLIFDGMEFTDLNYQAVAASDFGPAAVAQVEGEWNGTAVYLFKDMARSKAFADAWDGEPVEVEGSPAAAVMYMQLPTGVHAVLAIVNPDSSGFMIILPQNLNYASAKNLKDFVRIEPTQATTLTADSGPLKVTPANFGNVCNPLYQKNISSVVGIRGSSDLVVNSVSIPFAGERLISVKFTDGSKINFMTYEGSITSADKVSMDMLINSMVANNLMESPSQEALAVADEFFSIVESSEEYSTIVQCIELIDAPTVD